MDTDDEENEEIGDKEAKENIVQALGNEEEHLGADTVFFLQSQLLKLIPSG